MLPEHIRSFVAENHQAVLTTFRGSGAAQMSIITVGPYRNGVAFTTTAGRSKLANLVRDPRCTLLVSKPDWWGYVVLEGTATVLSSTNTDTEELRIALRDVYRAAAAQDHPNWEEYDQAMRQDRRSAVIVVPEHIYGTAN